MELGVEDAIPEICGTDRSIVNLPSEIFGDRAQRVNISNLLQPPPVLNSDQHPASPLSCTGWKVCYSSK